MISPTVGRKIWYRPSITDLQNGMSGNFDEPLYATVVRVIDHNHVNLSVLDHESKLWHRPAIIILATDDDYVEGTSYAEWMPYQIEQSKKNVTEAIKLTPDNTVKVITKTSNLTFSEALDALKLGRRVTRACEPYESYLKLQPQKNADSHGVIFLCREGFNPRVWQGIEQHIILSNDWMILE